MDEGWYPDPERAGSERWWDGLAWSEFTRRTASPQARLVAQRPPLVHRPDDATTPLAIMVGSPVWVGVLYAFISMVSVPLLRQMPPAERPLVKLAFLATMLLVLVGVAALDARVLRARGFASVPNPLWALATPITYLAKRAHVDGADRGPLIIHLVLLGVAFFGLLLGISVGIGHLAM